MCNIRIKWIRSGKIEYIMWSTFEKSRKTKVKIQIVTKNLNIWKNNEDYYEKQFLTMISD